MRQLASYSLSTVPGDRPPAATRDEVWAAKAFTVERMRPASEAGAVEIDCRSRSVWGYIQFCLILVRWQRSDIAM